LARGFEWKSLQYQGHLGCDGESSLGFLAPAAWDFKLQVSDRYASKSAWRQHTTAGSNTEAFGGPLVDQNGNWVRFQMRVNHEEFDYIYKNGLYSLDDQISFSHRPDNNHVELPLNEGSSKHGAMEIKLAWKELGTGDDPNRFFTRKLSAQVSEPLGPDGKPAKPRKFLAGLVGMHIAMRTQSSPEWIWATFEQIDNVPDPDHPVAHPSFYNPHPSKPLPENQLPPANAVQDPDTGVYTLASLPEVSTRTILNWMRWRGKSPSRSKNFSAITIPSFSTTSSSTCSGLCIPMRPRTREERIVLRRALPIRPRGKWFPSFSSIRRWRHTFNTACSRQVRWNKTTASPPDLLP
jgi:hypothetical protein